MFKTLWRWRDIIKSITKKLRALKTNSHIYATNHFENFQGLTCSQLKSIERRKHVGKIVAWNIRR